MPTEPDMTEILRRADQRVEEVRQLIGSWVTMARVLLKQHGGDTVKVVAVLGKKLKDAEGIPYTDMRHQLLIDSLALMVVERAQDVESAHGN